MFPLENHLGDSSPEIRLRSRESQSCLPLLMGRLLRQGQLLLLKTLLGLSQPSDRQSNLSLESPVVGLATPLKDRSGLGDQHI